MHGSHLSHRWTYCAHLWVVLTVTQTVVPCTWRHVHVQYEYVLGDPSPHLYMTDLLQVHDVTKNWHDKIDFRPKQLPKWGNNEKHFDSQSNTAKMVGESNHANKEQIRNKSHTLFLGVHYADYTLTALFHSTLGLKMDTAFHDVSQVNNIEQEHLRNMMISLPPFQLEKSSPLQFICKLFGSTFVPFGCCFSSIILSIISVATTWKKTSFFSRPASEGLWALQGKSAVVISSMICA